MNNLIILCILLLVIYVLSHKTIFKLNNINNNYDIFVYFIAILYVELFVLILSNANSIDSVDFSNLKEWYDTYKLAGVGVDSLILLIYIFITRYLVYLLKYTSMRFFFFVLIAIGVQMIFDILFYILYKLLPNNLQDGILKHWGWIDVSGDALFGDSILIALIMLLYRFMRKMGTTLHLFLLVVSLYLIPYIMYVNM